jgi:cobalt-precorrin-5B (C1)-methyltransferase
MSRPVWLTRQAQARIEPAMDDQRPSGPLRRGWTTGACAAAAAKAAYVGWVTGAFPDPVEIELPSGARPGFCARLARTDRRRRARRIVKDAGDDPDVTHGRWSSPRYGPRRPVRPAVPRRGGVGTVTRPGLPVRVGSRPSTRCRVG